MDDRYKILVVDDEEANLQKLRRTFLNRYPVLAANSGLEALQHVLQDRQIAVIVADQRMPDMTGVDLLRQTLEPLPHAIRIILTGYTDVDVLMEAINSCKVYRYMVKPWDPPDLLMTVERGLEAYRLAVENEQFRKELIRRERLARELEIAGEIQRYILPPDFPDLPGYEMAAEYHPAREVGGDLYDWDYDPAKNILQMVIGDVSGKSIPAALYGAVFSGHVRAIFAQQPAPGKALEFLNVSLIPRYQVANHVSVAYLRLDLVSGAGSLANGGMPYPYLLRHEQVQALTASGVPLGLMDASCYDELEFEMRPGDLLVLSTDGAADALDPEGSLYGEDRLQDSACRHSSENIQACIASLYRDIKGFTGQAEIPDDITILGLRRKD